MKECGLLYPLILNKLPEFFINQSSMWIIQKDHEYYADSKRLVEAWFYDIPKGTLTTIDVFSSPSSFNLNNSHWYIIDFRQASDEALDNRINLLHFKSLDSIDQGNFIYEIYQSVKGLVVYADVPEDIPITLQSLCVLGMTTTTYVDELLKNGCSRGISASKFDKTSRLLFGYHRLEDQPKLVYWPCIN